MNEIFRTCFWWDVLCNELWIFWFVANCCCCYGNLDIKPLMPQTVIRCKISNLLHRTLHVNFVQLFLSQLHSYFQRYPCWKVADLSLFIVVAMETFGCHGNKSTKLNAIFWILCLCQVWLSLGHFSSNHKWLCLWTNLGLTASLTRSQNPTFFQSKLFVYNTKISVSLKKKD